MNTLLPVSETEFSEVKYWEKFFKNRSKSFDWYGEYIDMIELFSKYVKLQDDILVVGCGNSTLSYDLHVTQKCSKICSIDISNTAVEQMLLKHANMICKITDKKSKAFDFKCVNVCNFSQDEDIKKLLPITCVIDKGTTDAIHSGGISSENTIVKMWSEINENLAQMGRYLLITLAQSHIVDSIVEFFIKPENNQWMVNVHEIPNSKTDDKSFFLPIFAFVFYKMKPNPSLPLVYVEENSFSQSISQIKSSKKPLKNPDKELKEWIVARQQLSVLSHNIRESKQTESIVNMVNPKSGLVRYHCAFARNKISTKKKNTNHLAYCVFIVPFGFNNSEIINNTEARLKMCRDHLNCQACLFVYLNPREYYTSRQAIQDELHSVAIKFTPDEAPDNYSIPFVSCHDKVYESKVTGWNNWLLETVETADRTHQRLVTHESTTTVTLNTVALTERDKYIMNFVKSITRLDEKAVGLYCGQACCTEGLDSRWSIFLTGLSCVTQHLPGDDFKLEFIASLEDCKTIDRVIYNSPIIDPVLIRDVLSRLSDHGIALLCCDDLPGLDKIVQELSLPVRAKQDCIEFQGSDKTRFYILTKETFDNIDLINDTFEKMCW